MTRAAAQCATLGLLASLAAFTCGCDKQADDRVVKTPTAKVRVLVFTRPPDDPDYRKTVSLSATSGNAKGARDPHCDDQRANPFLPVEFKILRRINQIESGDPVVRAESTVPVRNTILQKLAPRVLVQRLVLLQDTLFS